MRSPAFSITALTAPVKLRAVASGLMIEKVRSIAMISSLMKVGGELRGLYRRHQQTASDRETAAGRSLPATDGAKLRQFHEDEPYLKRPAHFRSHRQA